MTVLPDYAGAAPVTQLGHLLAWEPVPLTVREARRLARTMAPLTPRDASPAEAPGDTLVTARNLTVGHGRTPVLDDIDVDLGRGEVVALLGRNGSGKTTLLRALVGMHAPSGGRLSVDASVGYVPQDPNALLFAPTVEDELTETLRAPRCARRRPGRGVAARASTSRICGDRHPRSLSAGQRQRVAVAAVAVGGAEILLLDEPTRGIDPPSATALETALRDHRQAGGLAVMATHDVELAARVATRVDRARRRRDRGRRSGRRRPGRFAVRPPGPPGAPAVPHGRPGGRGPGRIGTATTR